MQLDFTNEYLQVWKLRELWHFYLELILYICFSLRRVIWVTSLRGKTLNCYKNSAAKNKFLRLRRENIRLYYVMEVSIKILLHISFIKRPVSTLCNCKYFRTGMSLNTRLVVALVNVTAIVRRKSRLRCTRHVTVLISIIICFRWCQDSSVGILTGWKTGVRFPTGAWIFHFAIRSRPALGHKKSKSLLPCSQELATCSCSGPNESSPHTHKLFL
jgi:hypothetical protein